MLVPLKDRSSLLRGNSPWNADAFKQKKTSGFGQPFVGKLANGYSHFRSVVGVNAFRNHYTFVVTQPVL